MVSACLFRGNFAYAKKFLDEALYKNLNNDPKKTAMLHTLAGLLNVGLKRWKVVTEYLWENPVADPESIRGLTTERDLAFYATIAGLSYYSRSEFKEYFYSKGGFKLLIDNSPDLYELGTAFINFDFETYFKILDSLTEEFKLDPYIQLDNEIAELKRKVMVMFIVPYKNIDLHEMGKHFGMKTD